ncbi:sensor domain-containing diguanylate cyclase [Undibacterium sp.]|uniref:sensor domain-containing diguanylate cyclase n=1 Tax=Undibacterium sp. TaxID=1914977 RepID=UPI002CB47447|nr:sensor domain-containing diguanylate cyclase [Undibacterium sp.]HTD06340.1 sensor domain-containing diguanylate cyclase [Undibacterium sp.]
MSSHPSIPRPEDEAARLQTLRRFAILDSAADADFDFLAEMAAVVCDVPYAFIALVDAERVWFKSCFGAGATQMPRDEEYCSWAILEERGLHIPNLAADARTAYLPLTLGPPHYQMYCGANLISAGGHRIGTLCVLDTQTRALSGQQVRLLTGLAGQAMALLELRARDRELGAAQSVMQKLATYDDLTGMLNRRALLARLQEEVERARRIVHPLSIIMLDLDHFKQINDDHGHMAGDVVLHGVGKLLRERLRVTDSAGRYGGEEICLILPGTSLYDATAVAEKLRQALAAAEFVTAAGSITVTASFGIAAGQPGPALTPVALLAAADNAMYHAKENGRNRVEAGQEI